MRSAFGLLLLWFQAGLAWSDSSVIINGTVQAGSFELRVGALVMAWPCEDLDNCTPPLIPARATTDQNGRFEIEGQWSMYYMVVVIQGGYHPWTSGVIVMGSSPPASFDIHLGRQEELPTVHYKSATADTLEFYDRHYLTHLKEPALCSMTLPDGAVESYRFLWRRHDHRPVLIHVTINKDGTATARYKESDGAGGWDFGSLVIDETIDVAEALATRVDPRMIDNAITYLTKVADEHFWPADYEIDDRRIVIHGAEWFIEGLRGDTCHVVTRHSPKRTDGIRQFGQLLMRAVGKRYYYDEMY